MSEIFYKKKNYKEVNLIITIFIILILFPVTVLSQDSVINKKHFKYVYLFSFETDKGKTEKAFGKPRTAAINSSGYIYTVIPFAKEVRVYNSQGAYLFVFGKKIKEGEEKGSFSEPSGITIDNEDNVYISDLDRDMVLVFDSNGEFKREFPIHQPAGKTDACAPFINYNPFNRLLYLSDSCIHRIDIYKPSGEFIMFFGDKGSALGKFGGPANCAFGTEGSSFIVDPGNFRVQSFNSLHQPQRAFGGTGTKEGEFVRPYGVAVDLKGRIYISDMVLSSIQVFDRTGNFLGVIKDPEDERFKMKQPLDIFFSYQNRLYVVDGEAFRIHVFQID